MYRLTADQHQIVERLGPIAERADRAERGARRPRGGVSGLVARGARSGGLARPDGSGGLRRDGTGPPGGRRRA